MYGTLEAQTRVVPGDGFAELPGSVRHALLAILFQKAQALLHVPDSVDFDADLDDDGFTEVAAMAAAVQAHLTSASPDLTVDKDATPVTYYEFVDGHWKCKTRFVVLQHGVPATVNAQTADGKHADANVHIALAVDLGNDEPSQSAA